MLIACYWRADLVDDGLLMAGCCSLAAGLLAAAATKLKINKLLQKHFLVYIIYKEGVGARRAGRGEKGRFYTLVLYNIHAILCYSIAQHMFFYVESVSAVFIHHLKNLIKLYNIKTN